MKIQGTIKITDNQSRFFNFFNELEADIALARKEKQSKLSSRNFSGCKIKRKS